MLNARTRKRQHKARTQRRQRGGTQLLREAIQKGDVEKVRELIASGANVNEIYDTDTATTPLFLAIEKRKLEIIRLLLQVPTLTINAKNNAGMTALMFVCQGTYKNATIASDILNALLEHPAIDVNAMVSGRRNKGLTALMFACSNKTFKDSNIFVQALVKRPDTNVNIQDVADRTALIYAVMNFDMSVNSSINYINVLKNLLSRTDLNVNVKDTDGRTALMYSCNTYVMASNEAVSLLLKKDEIDIFAVDKHNLSAFDFAKSDARKPKLLQDAIVKKLGDRITLRQAIQYELTEKVRQMIAEGADVNEITATELAATPLQLAIEKRNIVFVRMLLQAPTLDINAKNSRGFTALMYACYINDKHLPESSIYTEIPDALLGHPAIDVNVQATGNGWWKGMTALMLACLHDSSESLYFTRKLVGRDDTNINALDEKGRTALMYACINWKNNSVEAVRLLLTRTDIDVFAVDKNGKSALDYADIYEQKRILVKAAIEARVGVAPNHLYRFLPVPKMPFSSCPLVTGTN
jgi:ankyrin repeat protein